MHMCTENEMHSIRLFQAFAWHWLIVCHADTKSSCTDRINFQKTMQTAMTKKTEFSQNGYTKIINNSLKL